MVRRGWQEETEVLDHTVSKARQQRERWTVCLLLAVQSRTPTPWDGIAQIEGDLPQSG